MRVRRPGELWLQASVVTVGAFDGVHLGHQALVRAAVRRARELGVPAVAWTFDPPPRALFGDARILTPLAEKLRRLSALGPDHLVVVPFDETYARRSARAFLRELAAVAPLEVWVGPDFRFGRGRTGDVATLARCWPVRQMEPVCCPRGERISSSRIRRLLEAGRETEARRLLGWRPSPAGGRRAA